MSEERKNNLRISNRANLISPFYVMELLEKARAMEAMGIDIVHMEVGEPDFATPRRIKEEAVGALAEDRTFYTHSLGLPELRERIARYYRESEGVDITPDRIIITNGTSGAFLLLFGALLEKGDMFAVSDPGYPCYRNFGLLLNAEVVRIPVSSEAGFEVVPGQLRSLAASPRLLVISNPSNPTGTLYKEESLQALQSELAATGGTLIVDEIYGGLTYGREFRTSLSISDDIIVVNGFSKTHAMTGWRLGWMVVPEGLVRSIQKIAQNVFISPPTVSQYAAMQAFDVTEDMEEMRKTYEKRRDFLVPELKRLGFSIPAEPVGAFYIYAGIDQWPLDSMEFSQRALSEAKVAITPGYDFGDYQAGSYVRFSYATSIKMLEEGCRRLKTWLAIL